MPVKSRWEEELPNCSLQQWIFGSPSAPLPDRKAFLDADRPDTHFVTFSEYRLLAKRIALGLQAAGLKRGERVLLFSGNSLYFPSVFLGVLMAGGVFTGANPGFVARELAYQLKDSGASFMVAAAASIDIAVEAAAEVGMPGNHVFVFDTTIPGQAPVTPPRADSKGTRHWTELLGPAAEAEAFNWVEPEDSRTTTCCLNYSSGTTGVPKGVEISHYSYVSNGAGVIKVTKLAPDYTTAVKRHVGLCFLPMYHAYAQTYFVANFASQGVPVYVMPSFDFVKMLTHIQRFRVTHLVAVPPVLVALTKHPVAKTFDLSSLENVGCGAAPLAAETAAETTRVLGKPDLLVRQGWGMTEVTCTAMTWDPTRLDRTTSAVGEIMPNFSAKLVGADGVEVTKARTPGELLIAGPGVMRGYWRNPKATAETFAVDADGTRWLRTGDVAYVDSYGPGGLFFIVDRIKELIKVKGNQVAPAELEALLLERTDVADVAVVGVTIEGEEMPRAYIVRTPGSETSGEEIATWLEKKVSRHKRLRGGVAFTDVIPKNPSGKILRKILREKAKQEVDIDTEPTAAQRADAESQIATELSTAGPPPPSSTLLPPLPPSKLSPLMAQELDRVAAQQPLAAIDLKRYEAQEPLAAPGAEPAPAALAETLRKAYTTHTYLTARVENLELLERWGRNAWLVGNHRLEGQLRALEKDLADAKADIDVLTLARRRAQDDVAAEVKGLDEAWRSGVGRVLETEIAVEALRRQVLTEMERKAKA
ncbi:hypothetical protein ACHAQF_003514 [Verticillium nonalfalfae]